MVAPLETSDNTEITLVITDTAYGSEELAFSIDYVNYRITCPASGRIAYDDSVDIAGTFAVRDDPETPVWALFANLPPSRCTISMWVFYEDEIVCSGTQSLPIDPDDNPSTPNEINLTMECTLSVNPPSGDLEIISQFDVIHGNFCPQLMWLGAIPTVFDPGDPGVARIETTSFDVDGTCGQNCDPHCWSFWYCRYFR